MPGLQDSAFIWTARRSGYFAGRWFDYGSSRWLARFSHKLPGKHRTRRDYPRQLGRETLRNGLQRCGSGLVGAPHDFQDRRLKALGHFSVSRKALFSNGSGSWLRVFNTDQGCQFTALDFTELLKRHETAISVDGKGNWRDNIFIERSLKTLNYEEFCLRAYASISDAKQSITRCVTFYNQVRPYAPLARRTPDAVQLQPADQSRGITCGFIT